MIDGRGFEPLHVTPEKVIDSVNWNIAQCLFPIPPLSSRTSAFFRSK